MKKNRTCTKPLESDIQKWIMHYLRVKGVYSWVNKTQGTFDPTRKVFRRNTTMKGISDILGLLDCGTFLAIEVKRPGGKVSPEQIEFLEQINKNGGKAFIARSVEDVEKELSAYLNKSGCDDSID